MYVQRTLKAFSYNHCRLRYPACNLHVSHFHLLCSTRFSTFSYKRHYFRKKLLNIQCVFWFSLQLFFWNIFHYKKNWAIYVHKFILMFMKGTRYSYQILMKLEFYRQIFENTQISHFVKTRPAGAELFHVDERTDTETDMTKLAAFRNVAKSV